MKSIRNEQIPKPSKNEILVASTHFDENTNEILVIIEWIQEKTGKVNFAKIIHIQRT